MNLINTCYDIMDSIPVLWRMVEIKTQEMLYRQLRSYALELFRGEIDGNEFLTLFERTINNQLTKAWYEGALESDVFPQDMIEEDMAELARIINEEMEYVYRLGDDIIILSMTGGTLENFRTQIGSRLDMWANRYNEVANRAKLWFGGKTKYVWKLGKTEEHCETCSKLNGIVAWASEWARAKVVPGEANSPYLECHGWRCGCTLDSAGRDVRRTRNALSKILEITGQNEKSIQYPEGGHWVTINGDHVYIDKEGNPVNAPYLENNKDPEKEEAPEMTEERAKEIVEELSERFGTTNPEIVDNPDLGKIAHAARLGGGIEMDSEYINSYDFDSKYNDAVGINTDEIIVHEYGHIIEQDLMLKEEYVEYGLATPSVMREHGIPFEGSLQQDLYRIAKEEGALISDYATTNDSEYIAEAFVLYVRGPENYDRINPRVLDLFKKLDKKK